MRAPLLRFKDVTVRYGNQLALESLSFELALGESLGLVGESGSGKSTAGLAIPGLLPPAAKLSGDILFLVNDHAVNLAGLSQAELRHYRGRQIGLVFQEPMTALNPLLRIGEQISEVLLQHTDADRKQVYTQAEALLADVQLPDPCGMMRRYPHQLSGGQRQRVVIALAIACNPRLLIADEPTTALDPTVQRQVLELLKRLQARHGFGMVFITHDLHVVGHITDRVVVLKQGGMVEHGPTSQVLQHPVASYTRQLIESQAMREDSHQPKALDHKSPMSLLEFERCTVAFGSTLALQGISLAIERGEILGIIGESGSGKSTLARVLLGLQPLSGGDVRYQGASLKAFTGNAWRQYRKQVQLVFQDPFEALTPHLSIRSAFDEVLRLHFPGMSSLERRARLEQVLEEVGLTGDVLGRYPHMFSGGQRQRLCIARALLVNPSVLVLDEAVAALDPTIRSQVLTLLRELQQKRELTYLFISHDLEVVMAFCERVAVLRGGKLEQLGLQSDILGDGANSYTRQLLEAMYTYPLAEVG